MGKLKNYRASWKQDKPAPKPKKAPAKKASSKAKAKK